MESVFKYSVAFPLPTQQLSFGGLWGFLSSRETEAHGAADHVRYGK